MKVGVIVPAYNEEKNIPSLVRNLRTLSAGGQDIVEEVVIIDDGSTDDTRREAEGYLSSGKQGKRGRFENRFSVCSPERI